MRDEGDIGIDKILYAVLSWRLAGKNAVPNSRAFYTVRYGIGEWVVHGYKDRQRPGSALFYQSLKIGQFTLFHEWREKLEIRCIDAEKKDFCFWLIDLCQG